MIFGIPIFEGIFETLPKRKSRQIIFWEFLTFSGIPKLGGNFQKFILAVDCFGAVSSFFRNFWKISTSSWGLHSIAFPIEGFLEDLQGSTRIYTEYTGYTECKDWKDWKEFECILSQREWSAPSTPLLLLICMRMRATASDCLRVCEESGDDHWTFTLRLVLFLEIPASLTPTKRVHITFYNFWKSSFALCTFHFD